MAVKLNRGGFEHAKELVSKGKVVVDERDAWSEHQPSAQEENEFIDAQGFGEYGKWHLGVDDEEPKNIKKHYKFPLWRFQEGAPLCLAFRGEPRRSIQAL